MSHSFLSVFAPEDQLADYNQRTQIPYAVEKLSKLPGLDIKTQTTIRSLIKLINQSVWFGVYPKSIRKQQKLQLEKLTQLQKDLINPDLTPQDNYSWKTTPDEKPTDGYDYSDHEKLRQWIEKNYELFAPNNPFWQKLQHQTRTPRRLQIIRQAFSQHHLFSCHSNKAMIILISQKFPLLKKHYELVIDGLSNAKLPHRLKYELNRAYRNQLTELNNNLVAAVSSCLARLEAWSQSGGANSELYSALYGRLYQLGISEARLDCLTRRPPWQLSAKQFQRFINLIVEFGNASQLQQLRELTLFKSSSLFTYHFVGGVPKLLPKVLQQYFQKGQRSPHWLYRQHNQIVDQLNQFQYQFAQLNCLHQQTNDRESSNFKSYTKRFNQHTAISIQYHKTSIQMRNFKVNWFDKLFHSKRYQFSLAAMATLKKGQEDSMTAAIICTEKQLAIIHNQYQNATQAAAFAFMDCIQLRKQLIVLEELISNSSSSILRERVIHLQATAAKLQASHRSVELLDKLSKGGAEEHKSLALFHFHVKLMKNKKPHLFDEFIQQHNPHLGLIEARATEAVKIYKQNHSLPFIIANTKYLVAATNVLHSLEHWNGTKQYYKLGKYFINLLTILSLQLNKTSQQSPNENQILCEQVLQLAKVLDKAGLPCLQACKKIQSKIDCRTTTIASAYLDCFIDDFADRLLVFRSEYRITKLNQALFELLHDKKSLTNEQLMIARLMRDRMASANADSYHQILGKLDEGIAGYVQASPVFDQQCDELLATSAHLTQLNTRLSTPIDRQTKQALLAKAENSLAKTLNKDPNTYAFIHARTLFRPCRLASNLLFSMTTPRITV